MGKSKVFIWEHSGNECMCSSVCLFLGVSVSTCLSNRLISFNGKLILIIEQMALSQGAY